MGTASTEPLDDVRVIEPSRGFAAIGLRELWRYRELLYVFIRRNILVRYKQTLLGVAWAIIQPFFFMVVFTLFFGRLAGLDEKTGGVPYPVFAFAALLPWTFFSSALSQTATSVVGNSALVTKVYFPRLTIPISTVLSTLVDFFLASFVLAGLLAYYGIVPSPWAPLVLPPLILLAVATALGVGLWLAALNVRFRDVQYAVPFLVQLWLFVTPVVYPATLVDEPWRTVFGLNPMAGVVEGFRWTLTGEGDAPGPMVALSTMTALVILAGGAVFFRRVERTFADVV